MIFAITLLTFSVIFIVRAMVKMNRYQHQINQFLAERQVEQSPNIKLVNDVQFTESLLALGKVRLRDHDGSRALEPVEASLSASTRPDQSRTRVQEP
jgi:hypothetical protein